MPIDLRTRLSHYLPRLYGYAVSLTRNEDAARELVQETALRALNARSIPEEEPALRAWLFTIVRHAAIDAHRRSKLPAVPEPDLGELTTLLWEFDERYIATVTVREGLEKLPVEARDVLALVDIAGFSYAETAELLDIPVGTVMSRLSRARQALLTVISRSAIRPLRLRRGSGS